MGLDRLSYKRDALLIEASRILTPQFNPIAVSLTGAQVELLRNATAILHNESTFVSAYHDTYYYTASTSDFDAIASLVADLENKLMGNDNVIFGYNSTLRRKEDNTTVAPGAFVQSHPYVPAGEVWVVQGASFFSGGSTGEVEVVLHAPPLGYVISDTMTYTAQDWKALPPLNITMEEGDRIQFSWTGLVLSQRIISNVWGYRMCVPA